MPKKAPGQPTKFTPEVKAKLIEAIRKGAPYEMACNYAGICFKTFRKWILIAEDEKVPAYVQFVQDLKEAEGQTSLIWLDKIDKAMTDGVWQAAAWKLERRHAKHFSQQAAIIEMNERMNKLEEETRKQKEVDNGILPS